MVLLLGCGATNPAPICPVQTRSFGSERSAVSPATVAEPAFAVTFVPTLQSVGVRVRAAARHGLERWASVAHVQPDGVTAKDADGPISGGWKGGVFELSRAPKGFVEIAYALPTKKEGDVVASPSGYVRFYGEPLLVPVDLANEKTHVAIDFDFSKTPFESAASSFGIGKHVEADVAPVELSKGAWLAGDVYSARFHAFEGNDDFAWVGYAAFDPRWISAEIATLRTTVSQFFGDGHPPPFTMLLTIDKRGPIESTPVSIYPRWRGAFAIADVDAPWGIGARMATALALVSRFVGGRITGTVPAVSGLARYAAREILLASGTMTPLEYADEVNGEIAATLFADKNPRAAEVAHVALDANRIGNKTMRARLHDWAVAGHALTDADITFPAGPLADDAFGKCFARGPMKFAELDLGFDEEKTRATKTVVGVHGAAKAAGLREGEPLVSIRYDEGQAEHPVRVVVSRDGKNFEVKYRPIGRTKTAQGFHVVPGVDPSSCAR
jgi:hypothetical protein